MQHYSSSASEPVSILAMLRRFPDNRKVCPLFCTLIGIEGFVEAVVYVERNDEVHIGVYHRLINLVGNRICPAIQLRTHIANFCPVKCDRGHTFHIANI